MKLEIPKDCVVLRYKDRGVSLIYPTGFKLDLIWEKIFIEIEEQSLSLTYLKKWQPKVLSIKNTWNNLIKKYAAGTLYCYKVKAAFKHFPIILGLEGHTITVMNYLGLKHKFSVPLKDIKNVTLKDKVLHIESYNDILTGSDLNKLKALRYKTHHKNLDRRIFTDGFEIEKYERSGE